MNPRHHARQFSQGRKVVPPHARPSRPAPLIQRKSHTNAHAHGHSRSHSAAHAQPSPKKPVGPADCTKLGAEECCSGDEAEDGNEDEDFGMASFLQFCTSCERQIVTPDSSVLYCSEACRRRDSRPASLQEMQSIQQSIQSPPLVAPTNSYFDHRLPEIVPQLSPTILRPLSRTFSDFSLSNSDPSSLEFHEVQGEREVMNYLQQFYSSFNQTAKQQRPRANRTSTTSTYTRSGGESSTNLPSLSHSPSSSYGTVASNASYRPMMKQNPFSSTFATKSIELVIPYPTESISPTQLLKDASLKSSASTLTSFRVAEANDISHKASTSGSRNSSHDRADSTLKQLFSHDAPTASARHDG